MKRSILPLFICFFFIRPAMAQHFTANMFIENSTTAVFTIRPEGGDITGKISMMEFCLRWSNLFGNGFTFNSITNNTTDFPGMDITSTNNDITDSGFHNQHFVFSGLTTTEKTYNRDSVYEVFRVTIGGNIPPAFDLVANNTSGPYYFTVLGEGVADFTPHSVKPFNGLTDSAGSLFYQTYIYSILTLGLHSFQATVNDCMAQFTWVTATESEGSYFELQQSRDGASFYTIKTIPATGNPNGSDYQATVPLQAGASYFRLKIVDPNDRDKFSEIIALKSKCNRIFLAQVSPNPATGKMINVSVTMAEESNLEIIVSDINGRPVKKHSQHAPAGTNNIQLPLPVLNAGQYMLTVYSARYGSTTQKIFIR